MNRRRTWTLCAVIGASALGAAHGQAPDCDPATRACFDVRVDLPIAAEPSPREGYDRPTVNRYQNQELEIYRQLRMDQTPYTCATIGGEEGSRTAMNRTAPTWSTSSPWPRRTTAA